MIDCLKRHVVCIILDAEGNVLGVGRNQCDPPGWREPREDAADLHMFGCNRMHVKANEDNYDPTGCNSIHAEINAITNIKPGDTRRPRYAVLFGHTFACEPCRKALKEIGVTSLEIGNDHISLRDA